MKDLLGWKCNILQGTDSKIPKIYNVLIISVKIYFHLQKGGTESKMATMEIYGKISKKLAKS